MSHAHSAIVVDQSNDDLACPQVCTAQNAALEFAWEQGITTGLDGKLMAVDIYLNFIRDQEMDFWINIGIPVQVDSNDFDTTFDTIGGWNTIDVSSANIYLSAGDEFVFGLRGHTSNVSSIRTTIRSTANGGNYDGGVTYLNGEVYLLRDETMDLVFRTYVSTVPIPPAVWLFGSGLIGLIGLTRLKALA